MWLMFHVIIIHSFSLFLPFVFFFKCLHSFSFIPLAICSFVLQSMLFFLVNSSCLGIAAFNNNNEKKKTRNKRMKSFCIRFNSGRSNFHFDFVKCLNHSFFQFVFLSFIHSFVSLLFFFCTHISHPTFDFAAHYAN